MVAVSRREPVNQIKSIFEFLLLYYESAGSEELDI